MTPIVEVKLGIGVPRLQELGFLEESMRVAGAGGTYDQVRQHLISWIESRRDGPAASGRYMGVRRKPGVGGRQETRFMDNATQSLAELMRLGWIERSTLPSTARALGAYRGRRFALTAAGRVWLDQLAQDHEAALERLFSALWELHPQFAGYYSLLEQKRLVIPSLNWTDVFAEDVEASGPDERAKYVEKLSAITLEAGEAGEIGWSATHSEVKQAIEAVVAKRTANAKRRGTPFPYSRPQDFTRDCHKGLVAFAFERAGVKLDFTTHEILRRWGRELGVANFSYHVPDAPRGLRCWATAEFEQRDGHLAAKRRRAADFGDLLLEALPAAYEQARRSRGGGGFVPVYEVRQSVCWRLGLNGTVFDRVARDLMQGRRRAPYRLTPDRAYAGTVPPTESPLVIRDSQGRRSDYGLIMLTTTERSPR